MSQTILLLTTSTRYLIVLLSSCYLDSCYRLLNVGNFLKLVMDSVIPLTPDPRSVAIIAAAGPEVLQAYIGTVCAVG